MSGMDIHKIEDRIKTIFPAAVREAIDFHGQVTVIIDKTSILDVLRFLKDEPDLAFTHLADLCGIDLGMAHEPRYGVVYNLFSIQHRHRIRLRAEVSADDCSVDSAGDLWEGAAWHERECYDMFGIVFRNHADLRRVLMPEDWLGHPLRKDYPVEGPAEYWPGYTEVLRKAEEFKKYELRKR
ncbi:MAG TPA: NADH-quinone oxidoreductase subunit C [Dissulfurispiraceae bacterium]|nr:NADH-quinone oxidoreductase subunit C [Dissulfurispiraceae bacterium]